MFDAWQLHLKSALFFFPVGKLNNLPIFPWDCAPKLIWNTQNKTETLSNKIIYYKHIENPVAFNLAETVETRLDFAANRSSGVANRLWSLKHRNRELSLSGGTKFRSSVGCRKYRLASSQFTLTLHLRETARKRKISDIVAFTFYNSTKNRLLFQVSFFYNLSVASWQLSSTF